MSASTQSSSSSTQVSALPRILRLRDLTLLVIAGVIGSGIFLTPGLILKTVGGSVGVAALVWLTGGVLALLGALSYGELAVMKPQAGGLYVYIRDGFGSLPAFAYGWALFLAIASGEIAALSAAFATYLGAILPISPLGARFVEIAMIAVVTGLNVWGTRRSADVVNVTTLIKAGLVVVVSVILLALGRGYSSGVVYFPQHLSASTASQFGVAMVIVLWAYEGWHFATYSAGEAANPQKDFPRALVGGVLFLVFLYLLANAGYLTALGPVRAAQSQTIASDAFSAVLGPSAAKLIALVILVSVFSAANSVALTAPRVLYAMAADRVFFKRLARVHPRFQTPATAVVVLGVWAEILASVGTFQSLIRYAIFVAWIFYGLGAASVIALRIKEPNTLRPYRVPLYPWPPLLFSLAAAMLVLNEIVSEPRNAAMGIALVLPAVPCYFLWRKLAAKPASVRDSASEHD